MPRGGVGLPPSSHSAPVLFADFDDPTLLSARVASPSTPRDSGGLMRDLAYNFAGSATLPETDPHRDHQRDEIWRLVTERARLRYGIDTSSDQCPGPEQGGECYVVKKYHRSDPVEQGVQPTSHVNQGALSNFLVRMKTKTLGRRHVEEEKPYFSDLPKVPEAVTYEHMDSKLGIEFGEKCFLPPRSRGVGCACWLGLTDGPTGTDKRRSARDTKPTCCDFWQVRCWLNCFRFASHWSRYNENNDCLVCNKPLSDPTLETEQGTASSKREDSKKEVMPGGRCGPERGDMAMDKEASSVGMKTLKADSEMDLLDLGKLPVSDKFPTEEELAEEGPAKGGRVSNGATASSRAQSASAAATPKGSGAKPEKRTSSFIEGAAAVAAAVSRTSSMATNGSFRSAARPVAEIGPAPTASSTGGAATAATTTTSANNNSNNTSNAPTPTPTPNPTNTPPNPPITNPSGLSPAPSYSPGPIHTPPSSNPASFVASLAYPLGTASSFSSAPSMAAADGQALSRSRSREIE